MRVKQHQYNKIVNDYLKRYSIVRCKLFKKHKNQPIAASAPFLSAIHFSKVTNTYKLRHFLHEIGHCVVAPPFTYPNPPKLDIFIEEIKAETFAYNNLIELGLSSLNLKNESYIHCGALMYIFNKTQLDEPFDKINVKVNKNSVKVYNNKSFIANLDILLLNKSAYLID